MMHALDNSQIIRTAPSVFAPCPHQSRSERYAYIPTAEVLEAMRGEGFEPFSVSQARTRLEDRRGFTKHMIRFRHRSSVGEAGTVPEIVLINSHDGSSAYKVMSGAFRFICLNGLVCGDTYGTHSVPHKGDVAAKVIEASYTVLDTSRKALTAATEWQGAELSPDERQVLAESAHFLRFADNEGHIETPIQPAQLLRPRRRDDAKGDLWTTFNVVQENAIKGGLTAYDRTAHRRVTTRAIGGIDQDVKLNRALWMLGERMAQLKGVA